MNETERYSGEPDESADDPRLLEAVREYQAALDAGGKPDRQQFLDRYSDIADDLADCLDGLDLLQNADRAAWPGPPLSGLHTGALPLAVLPEDGSLGDFRLLREIGRGGMGIVYEATQISLGRRVALKVLPLASTLDSRQVQRFENEARAAAGLHHPNIVPVYAVGCERGVHFYAMQFIDGRTLAEVIEAGRPAPKPALPSEGVKTSSRLRRNPGGEDQKPQDCPPPPGLLPSLSAETVANAGPAALTHRSLGSKEFVRNVARLGVQAAEALEYAHQMGVVHRDVKPANLMLDSRNNLWVTDFGLARISAGPGLTAPGDLIGTLRYMSPEQAAGQPVIDPRSDIYALGATLYELLTGRPAVPGHDRRECLKQILDEEPTSPRRLNRAIPPQLETVLLKAMARRPEDRYPAARDLADDLKRFLEDQPIKARPPGLAERATRWLHRHVKLVASVLVVLSLAVLVLALATWRISQERLKAESANAELEKEQEKTRKALAQEAAQRARAEENYRQAREVLDYLNRLGVEEMAGKPEMQDLRRRLLTRLLDYYQALSELEPDPLAEGELHFAQTQVAELLVEVGRKADGLAMYERALREPGDPPRLGFPAGRVCLPRGIARLFLLGRPSVQEDLRFSEEQKTRARSLLDFQGRPPTNEEALTAEKGLMEILRPEQANRLEQVIRQTRGTQGLLDPETARALDLTGRQREQIQSALAGPWQGFPGPGRDFGKHPWPGRHGKSPGWFVPKPGSPKGQEQALRVLSPSQRERWRVLLGEPFRGELNVGPGLAMPKSRGSTFYTYYEGAWAHVPDFDRLDPLASGVGPAFDLDLARRSFEYGMKFTGYFRLEDPGEYTFSLSSDDGSRLYVDDKLVVSNDGPHPLQTRQGKVRLERGIHRLAVAYFQSLGPAALGVQISGPGSGTRNLGDLVVPAEADLEKPAGQ